MTELRQRMIQDMKIRNYSPKTIEAYTRHVACFAKHFGRSPDQLGPEDVRQYQVYLVEQKKASWSAFNQAVCALRFLYGTTLRRNWPVTMIPFGKKPKTLPAVLGPEEVQRLLACAYPLKQRVILTVLYAAGLPHAGHGHVHPAVRPLRGGVFRRLQLLPQPLLPKLRRADPGPLAGTAAGADPAGAVLSLGVHLAWGSVASGDGQSP